MNLKVPTQKIYPQLEKHLYLLGLKDQKIRFCLSPIFRSMFQEERSNQCAFIMEGLSEDFSFTIVCPRHEVNDNKAQNGKSYQCVYLDQFDTFFLDRSIIKLIRLLKPMYKAIQAVNPQLIHVQMPGSMVVVTVLKMLGFIKQPIVFTDRGGLPSYSTFTRFFVRQISRLSQYVVVLTESARSEYADLIVKDSSKLRVIPNTAGSAFEASMSDANASSQIKKIMFCGRFSPEKNWALAEQIVDLFAKGMITRFSLYSEAIILKNRFVNANNTRKESRRSIRHMLSDI